jgi:hypothetical protein
MKIEKLIKETLDKLPILYRTLTVEKILDKTELDKSVRYKPERKFYKATILPFKF